MIAKFLRFNVGIFLMTFATKKIDFCHIKLMTNVW